MALNIPVCAALLLTILSALIGCSPSVGPGALVLAQSPVTSVSSPLAHDALDSRYPTGSRIVLTDAPLDQKRIRVLSRGLIAAGNPIVSYDGRRVIFSGKRFPTDDWQIYEARLPGSTPQAITSMRGGAMQPALLPDGSVAFASPVPESGAPDPHRPQISQLYAQSKGKTPRQLTFAPSGASDPIVLSDGRILFVSRQPSAESLSRTGQALYTINNDGTELTPFAAQHECASMIAQPRQIPDGRVAFLARDPHTSGVPRETFEFVRLARPFFGWEQLFPNTSCRVRSLQPASNGNLLVCAENVPDTLSAHCSSVVFRVANSGADFGPPVFSDSDWKTLEAAEALPHARPMGRLSSMDPQKRTGQILCLNVNDTTVGRATNGVAPVAKTIRVLVTAATGALRVLGEVPVQADGSFMAEVPSDVPLGFEALDEKNQVLRRDPPMVWVRPGENRSCIGCHEPHNRSPRNHRPLAVRAAVPCLGAEGLKSAVQVPDSGA